MKGSAAQISDHFTARVKRSTLLTSLFSALQKALTLSVSRIVYWSDYTIVLQCIKSSPQTLKIFVANRVAVIQTKTNIPNWRHVPTTDKSPDLFSRGQTLKDFLRPTIWKNGPE
jgi:hypothetical protein